MNSVQDSGSESFIVNCDASVRATSKANKGAGIWRLVKVPQEAGQLPLEQPQQRQSLRQLSPQGRRCQSDEADRSGLARWHRLRSAAPVLPAGCPAAAGSAIGDESCIARIDATAPTSDCRWCSLSLLGGPDVQLLMRRPSRWRLLDR